MLILWSNTWNTKHYSLTIFHTEVFKTSLGAHAQNPCPAWKVSMGDNQPGNFLVFFSESWTSNCSENTGFNFTFSIPLQEWELVGKPNRDWRIYIYFCKAFVLPCPFSSLKICLSYMVLLFPRHLAAQWRAK